MLGARLSKAVTKESEVEGSIWRTRPSLHSPRGKKKTLKGHAVGWGTLCCANAHNNDNDDIAGSSVEAGR